jgi:uncharacterized DUF497 family protein
MGIIVGPEHCMDDVHVIWDLDDDPDGNVRHILEHDLTIEEVEDVLLDPLSVTTASRSSGEPITFGHTATGRYIAVVWEHIADDPLTMKPITAYETPEPK